MHGKLTVTIINCYWNLKNIIVVHHGVNKEYKLPNVAIINKLLTSMSTNYKHQRFANIHISTFYLVCMMDSVYVSLPSRERETYKLNQWPGQVEHISLHTCVTCHRPTCPWLDVLLRNSMVNKKKLVEIGDYYFPCLNFIRLTVKENWYALPEIWSLIRDDWKSCIKCRTFCFCLKKILFEQKSNKSRQLQIYKFLNLQRDC